MNIQTVAENLRNTIDGKEKYLATLKVIGLHGKSTGDPEGARLVRAATSSAIKYLEISIDELKRILQDVEQCVFDYDELKDDLKEANGRVRQLERQASDDSWITNPDRMGGGGWTADELDPNRGWK